MIWITHIFFGLLLGLIFESYFAMDNLVYYTLIILFSLLPDIDSHESKIGRTTPYVSGFIERVFGHRGIFHAPIFLLIIGFILSYFLSFELALVFILGYGSHLLIDSLTPAGINLLHPFASLKVKGFIATRSALEYFLLFVIIAIIVYLV